MAEEHVKHHDYHLVDPSPWPVVGSVAALFLAIGAIIWMKSSADGVFGIRGPWIFAAGAIGVLITMFLWWRDVVIEGVYKGDHTPVVQLSLRYGMILFIASEVMFFVAWFWAYFDVSLFPADVHKIADGLQGWRRRPGPGARRQMASYTHRGRHFQTYLRPLGASALQHARASHVGDDRDLGSSLAHTWQPERTHPRPHSYDMPWADLYRLSGL